MSEREGSGYRDLTYSHWHRTESTARFIGQSAAYELAMIDIDGAELCRRCGDVLALVETARGTHQTEKRYRWTQQLANRLHVPAYCVLYDPCGEWDAARNAFPDVARFRARRIAPTVTDWRWLTPAEWAAHLDRLRREHLCLERERVS